jgi:serine/threonine-protein kinase
MTEVLSPGEVVSRYRIENLSGQGGMGSVFRATHVDTGAACAVKSMHAEIAAHPDFRKRFLREARATMAIGHPNIVQIFEAFEHRCTPMFAMELLNGESLQATLEREGKLSVEHTARILIRVTSALGTAHALGIVHRDLKPDNIFITKEPTADVKVLDFGIAKLTAISGAAAATEALTRTGALMGTACYMSPEQASGEKRIDQRADIWSLGIIFYQCLSGVLPTDAASFGVLFRILMTGDFKPIDELVPDCPPDVAALIKRMLQLQPDQRPWDLREVHAVLERYASEGVPSFGAAVLSAPEDSVSPRLDSPERAPTPTKPSNDAMPRTTGPIKLASSALRKSTPTGTIVMGDAHRHPAQQDHTTLVSGAAPKTSTMTIVGIIVAIVALIVAAVVFLARGAP